MGDFKLRMTKKIVISQIKRGEKENERRCDNLFEHHVFFMDDML